jgi:hypothetical protein
VEGSCEHFNETWGSIKCWEVRYTDYAIPARKLEGAPGVKSFVIGKKGIS